MMKYLLIILIKIYWLIPKQHRKSCVFKESCSKFVYRNTLKFGLRKGLKCLIKRMRTCKPNYTLYKTEDGNEYVILADKSVVKRNETTI